MSLSGFCLVLLHQKYISGSTMPLNLLLIWDENSLRRITKRKALKALQAESREFYVRKHRFK
jgi:hypothetical protein